MACLHPGTMVNPRFDRRTEKGRARYDAYVLQYGLPPTDLEIKIPCGHCMGCLKSLAQEWRVRLLYENRYGGHTCCLFVTLTIAPEYYEQFKSKKDAASNFRHFIDSLRYYTPNRRSPKRFFISELGESTQRLHFHGLVWDVDQPEYILRRTWKYGFSTWSRIRSARAITYTTSYFTKFAGKFHKPFLFVSPGIGKGYASDARWLAWRKSQPSVDRLLTCDFNGVPYRLPTYLRKKIFTTGEIDRLKILLRDDFAALPLRFAGKTYPDEESFARARKECYELSLRVGRSERVIRNKDLKFNYLNRSHVDLNSELMLEQWKKLGLI